MWPASHQRRAALPHPLTRSHALVDGNKRLGWTACRTLLAISAQWIGAPEDDRFDLVIRVATCATPDLEGIAAQLRGWSYR
jgi:death-on-curing protein